jgi:hypothetical protein
MQDQAVAALIAGLFTLLGSLLTYHLATRRARRDLADRLKVATHEAAEDRATIERAYQIQATRAYLETVGGPKSQIIRSVYDLSRHLRAIFTAGDRWERVATDEAYRLDTAWRLVRVFVWIEILHRSMRLLDEMLADLGAEEYRFLEFCDRLQHAMSSRGGLFGGVAAYHVGLEARITRPEMLLLVEALIVQVGEREVCASETSFFERQRDLPSAARVTRLFERAADHEASELYRARLVAIWFVCGRFLSEFRPPFMKVDPTDDILDHVKATDGLPPSDAERIRDNITGMVRTSESARPAQHPPS